ncbi:hypothetical protein GS982_01695 [Rhodococcus hoagii]|uniref:4Fe-4S Wbl-type domain-containing protein n=1 Tax=Rhodococcus hoagii TaxID=43767 RepID=A0A9Q5EWT7_RHOHA|nr:hypothetical protein [Prescottella equi]NKT77311.1 hypothetical protein [Prescottella equi]NKZ81098.1 hypothetical protein [Prescottella equi]
MKFTPYDREWMIDAKCRGTHDPTLYESDNRGDGQREAAIALCGDCPAFVECARYALSTESPRGMIWASVPVPEMPDSAGYREAIRVLEIIASLPTRDEI